MKKTITIVILIAAAAAVIWGISTWYRSSAGKSGGLFFKTEMVARKNLRSTISASGTVEPEELVNVGAQVTGKIMKFGIDADGKTVDYGSRVKAGKMLAQIDDVLYDAEVRSAKAQKLQAEAAIKSAEANLQVAQARKVLADQNWARAKSLFPKHAMSQSDYDAAQAEHLSADANIGVASAAVGQAKAQLVGAEATLIKAERNLAYCRITSPVDGVIIDRRVSVGQTVVSSMSASSILLIAKDLRRMQVWASVNEADIGEIKQGMPVIFTVDAFPGAFFKGQVHKVRLNATMSQNVVTYVVEISTDNSSGKLLPYLTANVLFIKARRDNVLTVSNAALRFQPDSEQVAPQYRAELAELLALRSKPGKTRVLWTILADGLLKPVKVEIGLVGANATEIVSGITENEICVNGVAEASTVAKKSSGNAGGSPFMPKPPQHKQRNLNPGKQQQ